jgi:Cu2+-exporting ATPase
LKDHAAHKARRVLEVPELQGPERERELHRGTPEHAPSARAAGREHLAHGSHADVYRRRFWISLILAVPVVVYSEMVQDWFGYTAKQASPSRDPPATRSC